MHTPPTVLGHQWAPCWVQILYVYWPSVSDCEPTKLKRKAPQSNKKCARKCFLHDGNHLFEYKCISVSDRNTYLKRNKIENIFMLLFILFLFYSFFFCCLFIFQNITVTLNVKASEIINNSTVLSTDYWRPHQRNSNDESISMSWRHYNTIKYDLEKAINTAKARSRGMMNPHKLENLVKERHLIHVISTCTVTIIENWKDCRWIRELKFLSEHEGLSILCGILKFDACCLLRNHSNEI